MAAKLNSIRWRLLAAAVMTLLIALVAAGTGLVYLFERHVERRAAAELETDIRQLLSGFTLQPDGKFTFERSPRDQRYDQPFGGAYWQIVADGKIVEKSRSLWDEQLTLPDDTLKSGEVHRHQVTGPRGRQLLSVERFITVKRDDATHAFRIAAALETSEISAAVRDFRNDMVLALGVLGGLLLTAFAVAVKVGLSPFDHLRHALAGLRSGESRRLAGAFPLEVAPLVDDLNKVLDQRERTASQAKARAADLAHGLKTPLTAIEVMAYEFGERGETELASELSDYVADMQRHIERELAMTRSHTGGTPSAPVALEACVQRLVRSLNRLPNGAALDWRVEIDPAISVPLDEMVLTEVFGNLLDNARKWAKSKVVVAARIVAGRLVVAVSDDGPGVPDSDMQRIVKRGKRLDETVPGSGFGLAIVSDLLEQFGGRLELQRSPLGGLEARVNLPRQI